MKPKLEIGESAPEFLQRIDRERKEVFRYIREVIDRMEADETVDEISVDHYRQFPRCAFEVVSRELTIKWVQGKQNLW